MYFSVINDGIAIIVAVVGEDVYLVTSETGELIKTEQTREIDVDRFIVLRGILQGKMTKNGTED